MTLQSNIGVRVGALELDVHLDVPTNELAVLVGPNGAGKTTLLRTLAGLQPIDAGRILLDGVAFDEPARRRWVPPDRRSCGMVFQSGSLFPHMTVLDNVAFGLRCHGASRRSARSRAEEWLGRVGLSDVASSKPDGLSGGQAQRVALARALAPEPRLLLLDEPLAALDVTTRAEVRRELRRHLATYEGVRVLVTHDPVEAMALADRILVVEQGRITQDALPSDLRAFPKSRYVAEFVGVNLLRGRVSGESVVLGPGRSLAAPAAAPLSGDVLAVIHPRAVALYRDAPSGTPRNVWSGTVDALDDEGERVRVRVTGDPSIVSEITPGAVASLGLARGVAVYVSVKATEIDVYPA